MLSSEKNRIRSKFQGSIRMAGDGWPQRSPGDLLRELFHSFSGSCHPEEYQALHVYEGSIDPTRQIHMWTLLPLFEARPHCTLEYPPAPLSVWCMGILRSIAIVTVVHISFSSKRILSLWAGGHLGSRAPLQRAVTMPQVLGTAGRLMQLGPHRDRSASTWPGSPCMTGFQAG